MKIVLFIPVFCLTLIPVISFAHPGNTDSSGCHTCRTNCSSWGLSTGEYHCHQSKGISQPLEPVRSIKAQQITVPAPEYKTPKVSVVMNKNTQTKTAEKSNWFTRLFSWFK